MDDLYYKCIFEAERIVRNKMQKIEPTPSRLGSCYYKILYFHSPLLNKDFQKKLWWFVNEAEPVFTAEYLVKQIAEYLDFYMRYGG